jgi:branched-chain amino acid transport system substrate-binding protein
MRTIGLVIIIALLVGCGPQYSQLPPGAPAVYFDAQTALRMGNNERAIESFTEYLHQTDNPAFRPRAYYQLAQAQYGAKRYEAALTTLDHLKAEFPDSRWPQVPALTGDIQYALGDREASILSWEKAWAIGTEPDRTVLRPRFERAMSELSAVDTLQLREQLTYAEIEAMLPLDPTALSEDPPPPSDFGAEGTQLAASPQAMEVASDGATPGSAPSGEAELDAADEMVAVIAPLDAAEEDAVGEVAEPQSAAAIPVWDSAARVATVLPLTGPDKDAGLRALKSLRLAFSDSPQNLVVRDTGADLGLTAQLFEKLVSDPTVLAVIGPVDSDEAKVVAPLAQKFGMPLLLLSQNQELAGGPVMQFATTPSQQSRAVVEYARVVLKAMRFVVLYPDDMDGRRHDRHFEDEVNRQGGTIVGSRGYAPGQRSFGTEVATLRRWAEDKGVEAVFIPDDAESATALAIAVRQEIPELVLLGTESWNDPSTIAQAGPSIEGAVFVDSFLPHGGSPATQSFVTRFTEYAGHAPGITEAQAFDAAMLVRRALEQGADTREAVLSELRRIGQYDGAGQLHVAPGGFEPELFLLRVHKGRIEQIPAPAKAG